MLLKWCIEPSRFPRLAVAADLGGTRLIDNMSVTLTPEEPAETDEKPAESPTSPAPAAFQPVELSG